MINKVNIIIYIKIHIIFLNDANKAIPSSTFFSNFPFNHFLAFITLNKIYYFNFNIYTMDVKQAEMK